MNASLEAFQRKFFVGSVGSARVADRKPIHYLRKLAGETLSQQVGIYAASSYLGHSSVKVTQDYYATGRPTIAPSITEAMGGKVIQFPAVEGEAKQGSRKAKA